MVPYSVQQSERTVIVTLFVHGDIIKYIIFMIYTAFLFKKNMAIDRIYDRSTNKWAFRYSLRPISLRHSLAMAKPVSHSYSDIVFRFLFVKYKRIIRLTPVTRVKHKIVVGVETKTGVSCYRFGRFGSLSSGHGHLTECAKYNKTGSLKYALLHRSSSSYGPRSGQTVVHGFSCQKLQTVCIAVR